MDGEYFVMDCWGLDCDEPVQKPIDVDLDDDGEDDDEILWLIGQRISAVVPRPIEMEWKALRETDERVANGSELQKGLRNEQGVRRQWTYPTTTPPLFHRKVVSALLDCGVDNLDIYDTAIIDLQTEVICEDYLAVNVIGAVKAASLEGSDATVHSGDGLVDTDFDSLVLDAAALHGLKLFRLAESVNAIVIHGSVKKHLEARGGFDLTFTKPEDWIG